MLVKSIRKLLFLADIITINVIFALVIYLHYEGNIPQDAIEVYVSSFVLLTVAKIFIYKYFGLYDSIWEYASIEELMKVIAAVFVGNVLSMIYLMTVDFNVYFGIYLSAFIFEVVVIGGNRLSYRVYRRILRQQPLTKQAEIKKSLIIGSGATASLIATEIKNHKDTYGAVVGFIDDDPDKYGKSIAGTKVIGNRYDIFSVANKYFVTEIIVATPTLNKADMKEILEECKRTTAKVRIMPGVREMIDGQVSMSKIRDVEIEDLLGRDEVNLNVKQIASYIEGQVIMVTGGGGSIGSELCRQIAKFNPQKLIILDIYENNAYDIQNEIINTYKKSINLDVVIASVRDRETIFEIVKEQRPDVIFHAAAHKHVPLMERSPKEAIKNNVLGTQNIAEAADKYGVKKFVMISTDKAVNPTNMMGASKRICEMIIQGLARQSKTNFNAVRFGNVLGSNGSVIPLFKRQIKEGGPLTVTHKEIIRYFMTIPEATQLVIQAGALASGGEIFVLDMGEPVKIYDLAYDIIKLSGFKPNEDIMIEITGLRPGEKLYEELLMADEELQSTECDKIYIGQPAELEYQVLKKSIDLLANLVNNGSNNDVRELVKYIVPTYKDNKLVNSEKMHAVELLTSFEENNVQ
ncbi:MAG: nucleoside-diphosphate sugar epimerase [Firmicutes bacterium HGW-Firmicutes-2]|jgi:FlaA1/EpsC-like NDP-sugar epimerase|nr:MAG: nucleoside-diphosphate sugar epimerase [Firmicutes bacterium HGW-Firmicutes-2]